MKVLALIPARSGSKGVRDKNIRLLAGKPLLAWMVEKAKRAELVTRVIVSTDSERYAEIARRYGAETPFLRPAELASDVANDLQVLTHAVTWLGEHEGYRPDLVLRLQPTNPTFPTTAIDEGIRLLLDHPQIDSVRAVTPSPKHPYKMWRQAGDDGRIEPFLSRQITGFAEPFNMGRQQLPPVLVQVGAMEVLRYRTLMELHSMAGDCVLGLPIDDPLATVNIDTELDFIVAETAMQRMKMA